MRTCVKCGKKGLFLWLSKNGYCESCAIIIREEQKKAEKEAIIAQEKQLNQVEENQTQTAVQSKAAVASRTGNAHAVMIPVDSVTVESLQKTFIAIDVETTGLSPTMDRIVEIGAVLFVDGKPKNSYSTLVNPHIRISESASAVNHITNDMLATAPSEDEVYPGLAVFLGKALEGTIILCAYNAKFDLDFLCNTFSRLGYDANIRYVDSLRLSKKYVRSLENYKQNTVAKFFGLINRDAHRASSDAEICGGILCGLLELIADDFKEQKKQSEKIAPSIEELEVCAYIQDTIIRNGGDAEWLRYRKNSSNYVDITYLYSFLKFKFSKKGKYIIVKKDVSMDITLETEPCSVSEGGSTNIRVYFNNPLVLEPLSSYIYSVYKDCRKSALEYIKTNSHTQSEAEEYIRLFRALSSSEVASLVMSAENRKNEDASITEGKRKDAEHIITRDDVDINPTYTRVPLRDICNTNNWNKGFEAGFPYWKQGETARKEGKLDKAILLFDKARYNGYNAPALYDSYAKAYRQLKDYENEIVILEECIERKVSSDTGVFEARRNKAIELLFTQQQVQQKAVKIEQKVLKKKKEETVCEIKKPKGRAIIQMKDDYTVVSEYESITAAVNATGTSSKSIRDAANGVQKHAGGYRWKYKDQFECSNLNDTV